GTYFWRIYAVGADGLRSLPSAAWSFSIDRPEIELPAGTLAITVQPRGDVYVDDSLIARNQPTGTIQLDSGTHVVRVENSGSRERRHADTVQILGNDRVERSYAFTFPPAQPQVKYGKINVGSRPRGAAVYIDGELQKQKTNYTFQVPTGRHIVRGVLAGPDGNVIREDTVRVATNESVKVIFEFEP
ncbi:MAG: PEGA domain-containing protein, partial [candidate division Zixibacteria bacterium]|nr:PEGA domain-containing protein [candidate division Zixibacteria bacterium]